MLDIPTPVPKRRPAAAPAARFWAPLVAFAILASPSGALAQLEMVADYVWSQRRWAGDRVTLRAPTPRPDQPIVVRSEFRPLAVHASPETPEADARAALEALEAAYDALMVRGWAPPPSDGGAGGSYDFDLYLQAGLPRGDDAFPDARVLTSYLDSAPAFAVVDPTVGAEYLSTCVTSAYAQAMLIGQDPAEARSWREATATYLTWSLTGVWGCDDGLVATHQQQAHRGWTAPPRERGDDPRATGSDPSLAAYGGAEASDGGAILLAEISERHDRGTGRFVRDIWQIARQRTWERRAIGLRASPDVWEAIEAALSVTPDELPTLIEDLAIARYYVGDARVSAGHWGGRPWAGGLPGDAEVPVSETFTWAELPKYTRPHEPPLEPFGSAYFEVDVREAREGDRLRLWLRGEFGVRWSFVAVSLDAQGRELGRLSTPPRRLTRSYTQVDFTDRRTARVVVVVTNLSSRLPDADEADDNVRSFRVIFDHGEDGP